MAWSQALSILHHERPAELSRSRAGGPDGAVTKPVPFAQTLSFVAFGRRFDVQLEANDRVRSRLGLSAAAAGRDVELLRGELANIPGSWARLTRARGRLSGLIWDGAELYAIEPFADIAPLLVTPDDAPSDDAVVYRWSDVHGELADTLLPVALRAGSAAPPDSGTPSPGAEKPAISPLRQVSIALIADAEFAATYPAPVERLLAIANNVDGIYATQLGLHINVAEIDLLPQGSGQLAATEPDILLNEVAAYKGSKPQLRAQGLAHFFTLRELQDDNNSVGIAYLSSVCHATTSVGLTRAHSGVTTSSLIAAHEIGHNLGAGHDGDTPCAETSSEQYLMAPRINGSGTLSQCSIEQMVAELATASCLSAVSSTADLALQIMPPAPQAAVLLGEAFDVRFQVANDGGADSSAFEIEFGGATVSVVDVRFATAGNPLELFCAYDPPTVPPTCALSRLPAGQAVELIATLRLHELGPVEIELTTRSEGDGNPANDSASIAMEGLPSLRVGYVMPLPAPSVHTPGDVVTREIRIINTGELPADDVDVLFNLSSRLLLESLHDAFGTPCTPTGFSSGSYRCESPVLPTGTSTTFTLTVTIADDPAMTVGWLYDRSVGMTIETALPNQETQRSRTLTLQATPLIADLQAGMTAPQSLPPGISTEIAFSATNLGPDAVSDVTLRYSNPRFEVGTIDAGDGVCDQRSTGSIVCTIERLEAAETYRVSVQTVPRAGTHTAEVTIDGGNRYDPDLVNNVLSRSITSAAPAQNTPSTAPPSSGGSGGSGAVGWLGLCGLLGLLTLSRMRRDNRRASPVSASATGRPYGRRP